jgi:hypothetical protein
MIVSRLTSPGIIVGRHDEHVGQSTPIRRALCKRITNLNPSNSRTKINLCRSADSGPTLPLVAKRLITSKSDHFLLSGEQFGQFSTQTRRFFDKQAFD